MKKLFICMSMTLFILFSINTAGASTIGLPSQPTVTIFEPDPADLYDLSHGYYYIWGENWSIPQGETIVGATLFFDNIRNYNNDPNQLWVHLLDSAPEGVEAFRDNLHPEPDKDFFDVNYSGTHMPLNSPDNGWHDLNTTPRDITHTFNQSELDALNAYADDGNFGLGFDPDCHFYNDGIKLTIETAAVPIPGALWLLASGLVGLVGIKRRSWIK